MEKFKRERQARWDKKHIKTVSTKIAAEDMERLKALCKERKTTPYAFMRELLLSKLRAPQQPSRRIFTNDGQVIYR